MGTLSKVDIAKALDVDPSIVTRWAKRGMPVYDVEAARRWRSANIRPRTKPQAEPPLPGEGQQGEAQKGESSGSEYWQARTRRETAEATKAELQLQEMAGDLVKRELVERASYEAGRLLRDMVLSVPTRVASELAALTTPHEVESRLRAELRKVLAELSRLSRTGLEQEAA